MTAGFQLFECWDKGNLVGESPGNASLHEGGTPGSRNSIYCCNYHRLASAQRSCTHLDKYRKSKPTLLPIHFSWVDITARKCTVLVPCFRRRISGFCSTKPEYSLPVLPAIKVSNLWANCWNGFIKRLFHETPDSLHYISFRLGM